MKYIDLFAGVGGFRYGIEASSRRNSKEHSKNDKQKPRTDGGDGERWWTRPLTCVYSNEYDKYANSVYRKHFGECDDRDIRTVTAEEIPDHDLLCGGFPCQAFSVAGKRGGFDDTRGTLFFEIARILKAKKPRYVLLENVKGLLSHDGGRTFSTILGVLSDLGYDCQWQVLNSKDFGVPQNRERVFIVGHTRGTPRPKVFPITGTSGKDIEQLNTNGEPAFTVNTQDRHGIYDGIKIRKLTPLECERLQGFEDCWTQYGHDGTRISDTQRYKMMGNAVTTNVITKIIDRLFDGSQTR